MKQMFIGLGEPQPAPPQPGVLGYPPKHNTPQGLCQGVNKSFFTPFTNTPQGVTPYPPNGVTHMGGYVKG